jgi:hypothetical protein
VGQLLTLGRLHVMTNTRQIPVALSVVSYVFLVLGILAFIGILGSAIRGSFYLDFNILDFWIFSGLRRYSLGWRTCALVFIWIMMLGCVAGFIYGFFGHGPAFIKIFGKRYTDIPVIWVSIFAAVFFALEFWMYRVLTRPSIRRYFYIESHTPAA